MNGMLQIFLAQGLRRSRGCSFAWKISSFLAHMTGPHPVKATGRGVAQVTYKGGHFYVL